MSQELIDTLATKLAIPAPRRRALGWLATAMGAGLVAAVPGAASADAKRRRPAPKPVRKPKPKVCKPGKRFASILVPSRGVVETPVLKKGQRFIMRATGAWSTNQIFGNDAFASFRYTSPANPVKEYNGVRIGLAVDNQTPDAWGLYNPNHIYQRLIIGQNRALSLNYQDPEPADNSGSILVELFCE